MLKNMLKKIKQQKSSVSLNQNEFAKNKFSKQQSQLNNQQIYQVSEEFTNIKLRELEIQLIQSARNQSNAVANHIQRITYFYNSKIPNIFIKVMACPISHFNLLPFSQRKVKQIDLIHQKFPQYLVFMKPLLKNQLPTYNHLLINWYPKGVGIMHHLDGSAYKDKVVVLSLGGPAIITFCEDYKKINKKGSILLQDRSIHIFQQEAYSKCLHGIQNYQLDTIFLRINVQKSKQDKIVIDECSIDNFWQTNISKMMQSYKQQILNKVQGEHKQIQLLHFTQNTKAKKLHGLIISIQGNNQYNWKVQIIRQERISITIRQKLQVQIFKNQIPNQNP